MIKRTRAFWQIEEIAKNLLKTCDCYENSADNINLIIASCKLDLIPLDLNDDKLLGLFGKNGNKRFIAYNKNVIKERILFTKAHELGHYVLGHDLVADICKEIDCKDKNPQETEANVFASALLMPKDLFRAEFIRLIVQEVGCKGNFYSTYNNFNYIQQKPILTKIQIIFHTSFEAINYRIKNLFE